MEAKGASKITRLDPWTMCFVPAEGKQQDVVPKHIADAVVESITAHADLVYAKFFGKPQI